MTDCGLGDAWFVAALTLLAIALFWPHLTGRLAYFGDSDRLNTFLNVRLFEVEGVRSGLRVISFPSAAELPWDLLARVNVNKAVIVDPALYFGCARTTAQLRVCVNALPVLPRQFLVEAAEPTRGPADAIARFVSTSLGETQRVACVEGISAPRSFDAAGQIKTHHDHDVVRVLVDPGTRERLLVLNELYHPAWQASTGSTSPRITPFTSDTRGVIVPAGASEVVLRFVPFIATNTAYAIFAVGAAGVVGGWWWQRRREPAYERAIHVAAEGSA